MYIVALFIYWYVYSKFYILGSLFVTHILNVAFKKLWLSPLIINASCLILLIGGVAINFIKMVTLQDAIYRIYLPIVFSSICMNIVLFIVKKLKEKFYGKI